MTSVAVVGGGMLVMVGHEFPREPVDVGGRGEPFVHHVVAVSTELDLLRKRTQRRAHDALIEQFSGAQAFRVAEAGCENSAVRERNEIRRRAADVHHHGASRILLAAFG